MEPDWFQVGQLLLTVLAQLLGTPSYPFWKLFRSFPVMVFSHPQSYEPDELTKEMAHLEGLMKDLNAITTA